MATTDQTAPNLLSDEILADARRQAERVTTRARQLADEALARAATAADRERERLRAQAQADAARRTELTLATVPVDVGRMRAARTETLLQRIRDEAAAALRADGDDRRGMLTALAAEPLAQMDGVRCAVRVTAADRAALGEAWLAEVCRRAGRTGLDLQWGDDLAPQEAGLVVVAADGRQEWDNRLDARLDRLWPDLRRELAVHAGLVARPAVSGAAA